MGDGEIVGLLGPNGAGKSTMMNIISGVIPADKGLVKIDGFTDVVERKRLIGFAPEDDYYYENLTSLEYLNFVSNIKYGSSAENINELLELYELSNHANKLIRDYSLGMKRKLTLCQAFLNNPRNIMLDDPTNALDPKGIYITKQYLKDLKKDDCSILVMSHILDFVMNLCDRVILLRNNTLKEVKDLTELEMEFINYYE